MNEMLNICIFAHSWRSDWNHGNAHFLRGLAAALVRRGHRVRCFEPENSWSFSNLSTEGERGRAAVEQFEREFPELQVTIYSEQETALLEDELRGADVVLVHEWNTPLIVNHILSLKKKLRFRALFHDTHHRAYTNPGELLQMQLKDFDGVLVFGDALQRIYRRAFGVERVWTFHEAADVDHFHPVNRDATDDVIWIGNWGDNERACELEEFLLKPLRALRCRAKVYGVRYPVEVQQRLQDHGISYGGYLPNLAAKNVYNESLVSVHIPRRFYSNGLSGVPTIRVFEALACGSPLVCSPWLDNECLFRPHEDYVVVPNGEAMRATLSWLIHDAGARAQIAAQGVATIRKRHTCQHRAEQLFEILEELER